MNEDLPDLRVVFATPPRVSAKYRVRQVLWALLHVQMSEPKPGVFVLNRAGVPYRLFSVASNADAETRARATAADLQELGVSAFCERYHVADDFLNAVEIPRKRLPQLHPLL
jgi:hypothetical protein